MKSKEKQFKQHFATTFRQLTKIVWFQYTESLVFVHFPKLTPPIWSLVEGAEEPILLAIMNKKEFERESCDQSLCAIGISSQSANFITLKDAYFKIYMCFKQPHFYTVPT